MKTFRSLYLKRKAEEKAFLEAVKTLVIIGELYIIALMVKVVF